MKTIPCLSSVTLMEKMAKQHGGFRTMAFALMIMVCLILSNRLLAQKEANIWYFGNHTGIDFNKGKAVAITDGAMETNEGCASIADTNGKLLFYSDGHTVWDRRHNAMPGGDHSLDGSSSSTQSCVIVPKPGDKKQFYIFTVDCVEDDYKKGLRYSVVDLSKNGGYGDVVSLNTEVYARASEKLTAIQHANGIDYWIVTHEMNSAAFCAHLLTANGLASTVVKSYTGITYSDKEGANGAGCVTISPDGSKLAVANMGQGIAQLFDFDNGTGRVSYQATFQYNRRVYGASFSPDNKKLYVGMYGAPGGFYQYDLSSGDSVKIKASAHFFRNYWTIGIGYIQLGPDKKIYVINVKSDSIGVINNPNETGAAAKYVQNGLYLKNFTVYGLPGMMQSFFAAAFSFNAKCSGSATTFQVNNRRNIDRVSWDFGDPLSTDNTSTSFNPSHVYIKPGNYTALLTVYKGSAFDTMTQVIHIIRGPVPDQTHQDIKICEGDSLKLDMSQAGCTYLWSDGSTSPVLLLQKPGNTGYPYPMACAVSSILSM